MNKMIPNLNGKSSPIRSSSFRNMESVYSAIVALVNILGLKHGTVYLTALHLSFQRINHMFAMDAVTTISELKRLRLEYINMIRGGPAPCPLPENERPRLIAGESGAKMLGIPEPAQIAAEAGADVHLMVDLPQSLLDVVCIQSILDLRARLVSSGETSELQTLDMLTIALLDINQVVSLPPVYNYATIEGPHNSEYAKTVHSEVEGVKPTVMGDMTAEVKFELISAIEELIKPLGFTPESFREAYKNNCSSQQHIILNSAGPNGPATWTAYSDALAMTENLELLAHFHGFCEVSKLRRFFGDMYNCVQLRAVDVNAVSVLNLGRIHTFDELGGKTRHVAIADYWSQLVLTPLHDTIFAILKAIPMDATFNQEGAVQKVKGWTMEPNPELFSYDLTAATDRLPVSLQARILNAIGPRGSLGRHWAGLQVGRDYIDPNGLPRRYAVGAPMGLKSNWAVLALTHHIIVQAAARSVGIHGFDRYVICGDDIVIASKAVATAYTEIIHYLGLTINLKKSIVHVDGLTPALEFCKRIMIGGTEYTAFPTKLISKTIMNGRLLPQLQTQIVHRGVVTPGTCTLQWFAALTDSMSVSFMIMLNMMPLAITGLPSTLPVPAEAKPMNKWFHPHYDLTHNDLVQAYTYVAATEQLKRLDALMRQTVIVVEAIMMANASKSSEIHVSEASWALLPENSKFLEKITKFRGDLSTSHPIFEAARLEAIRVTLLLTQLSNGSMSVESAARGQLLDSFRNALASMWEDSDAARAQADRTLLTKALDTIESIIEETLTLRKSKKDAPWVSAMFSTKLQFFDKNWSVSWSLGGNVLINTVKTRVLIGATESTSKLTTAAGSLPISRKART